jgi:predicted exporter
MNWKKIALIGVLLAAFGLSTASRSRLNESENIFDILPQAPEFADYRELMRVFRPDNKAFFLIAKAHADTTEDELLQAADELAEGLIQAGSGGARVFPKVTYRLEIDPMEAVGFYLERQGAFFGSREQENASGRMNRTWLAERFAAIKKQLLNSPAPGLMRVVVNDPLDLSADQFQALQDITQIQEKVTVHRGRLFSEDLHSILVIAEPAGEISDVAQSRAMVRHVERISAAVRERHPGIATAWMSGHRFSVENSRIIRADVIMVFVVSMTLIFLWLWLTLRQLRSVLVLGLPSVFGLALAFFLASLTQGSISIMAVGMASILLGIIDDYGIYILCYGRESGSARQAAGVVRHPLFMAVATTLIAFAALLFTRVAILRQLGQIATFAVVGAAVFAIYFLPPLISWFGLEQKSGNEMAVGQVQRRLLELSPNRSLLLLGLLSLLLIPGLGRLEVENDLQKFSAVSGGFQHEIERIGRVLDMERQTVYAAVHGDDLDSALELNYGLFLELQRMKQQNRLQSVSSIAAVLPPRSRQESNLRRWHAFWGSGNREILAAALRDAAAATGVAFPVFRPYLEKTAAADAALVRREDLPPGLQDLVGEHLRSGAGKTYVLSRIVPAPGCDIDALQESLRRWDPGLIVADMGLIRSRTMRLFTSGLFKLSLVIFALISLFLLLFLRDVRRCLAILLPLLLAGVWTLGALGWLGVKIDASSCMISIIIFGVIIDYSIYITDSIRRGTFGALPLALTLSWLSTVIGFGALLLARHPVLRAFGTTTIVSTVCGWLAVSLSSFIYLRLQKK